MSEQAEQSESGPFREAVAAILAHQPPDSNTCPAGLWRVWEVVERLQRDNETLSRSGEGTAAVSIREVPGGVEVQISGAPGKARDVAEGMASMFGDVGKGLFRLVPTAAILTAASRSDPQPQEEWKP